jgi:probable HAF family extracellular repeat protein
MLTCWVLVNSCLGDQYQIFDLGQGEAYGINDAGQVVGTFGFWDNGVVTKIKTGDYTEATAVAINNLGQATGTSYADGVVQAYIWDKNNGIKYLPRFAFDGFGYGLNDSGEVVGSSSVSSGYSIPCIWDETNAIHGLNEPYDGPQGNAYGINNLGQVVGYEVSGFQFAFIWDETNGIRNIGFSSFPEMYANMCAYGINDLGQVVGASTSLNCAFLWDEENGTRDLGKVTATDHLAEARAINEQGQVVGFVDSFLGVRHAALFDSSCNGNNIDLNDMIDPSLGWTLEISYDINNYGQIVGVGNLNGNDHAFFLIPIPEPFSLSLLAFGGLGLLRKRRMSK